MYLPIVALVGVPNVGKSTFFNRLLLHKKHSQAIVHNQPGVTRDRKYGEAKIGDIKFLLIDTAGLVFGKKNDLAERMNKQTIKAINEADLVCFVTDGKLGLSQEEFELAKLLRCYAKKIILVANKCEGKIDLDTNYYKLGFGEPVAISAEHFLGFGDLYDAGFKQFEQNSQELLPEKKNRRKEENSEKIEIVISGRPNAGKSTLINAILNEDRLLTGAEAGLTRESIAVDFYYNQRSIRLIDSAGVRKKTLISSDLEQLSVNNSLSSINLANIVILMIDATYPLSSQDLNIASYVLKEGRGLIIAINKWDLIQDKIKYQKAILNKLDNSLSQAKGLAIVFISAINKANINELMNEVFRIYDLWNKKIPTNKLNTWLNQTTNNHQPALQGNGQRIRIKYITQIKIRPPSFKLFTNYPEKISESYQKYLINKLRESFGLFSVPIRFYFSKSKNPFVKK